ncbi:MAG: hypothetical protein LUI12_05105 [Clostridiales bacterium]|nr:hypothetical protein [Clostridiales bacterium]
MEWKLIEDGLPPIGVPIICTVKDHFATANVMDKKPVYQLRYPCYYMKNRFTGCYEFCFETVDNVLLKEVSEVIAWTEFPYPYEGVPVQ